MTTEPITSASGKSTSGGVKSIRALERGLDVLLAIRAAGRGGKR